MTQLTTAGEGQNDFHRLAYRNRDLPLPGGCQLGHGEHPLRSRNIRDLKAEYSRAAGILYIVVMRPMYVQECTHNIAGSKCFT